MNRTHKYNAKKAEYDDITFDSQMECDYYKHIQPKMESGIIKKCILQPKYELVPKFGSQRAVNYVADFEITYIDDTVEVIDIKGYATSDAKLKAKMFRYQYQDMKLTWITKAPKYWHEEWIEYETLQKVRRMRKKEKR